MKPTFTYLLLLCLLTALSNEVVAQSDPSPWEFEERMAKPIQGKKTNQLKRSKHISIEQEFIDNILSQKNEMVLCEGSDFFYKENLYNPTKYDSMVASQSPPFGKPVYSNHLAYYRGAKSNYENYIDDCHIQTGNDINAEFLWRNGIEGDTSMIVAIIDTGINFYTNSRGDSTQRIGEHRRWKNPNETFNGKDDDGNGYVDDVYGYNFHLKTGNPELLFNKDYRHGTVMAGIVGMPNDSDVRVSDFGLDYKCKIMNLVVFPYEPNPQAERENTAEAIRYAVDNGAKIINLSLGGGGTWVTVDHNGYITDRNLTYTKVLDDAISYAWQKGAILVSVAGNQRGVSEYTEGYLNYNHYSSMGNQPELLTVGSINTETNAFQKNISMWGKKTDVVTYDRMGGGYSNTSIRGTSNASALVTGMLAIYWANNPHLENWEVKRDFIQSAQDEIFQEMNGKPYAYMGGADINGDGRWSNITFGLDVRLSEEEKAVIVPELDNWIDLENDVEGWDQYYGYGRVRFNDLFENNFSRTVTVDPANGAVNGYERPSEVSWEDIESCKWYDPSMRKPLDAQKPQIAVYPNPFTDRLNIRGEGEYVIYSLIGKKMMEGVARGESTQVTASHLPSGIYVMVFKGQAIKITKI